jgi:beta-lactamase class A
MKFSVKKVLLLVIFLFSLAGNIVFIYLWQTVSQEKNRFTQLEKTHPLLSKRILADFPQDILINFLPLRSKLQQTTKPYGDSFALYFEYLPTGTSIGINEKSEFIAASLFKLPIVMAYYRHKERLKDEHDPTVTLSSDMLDDRFGDLWKKGEGYSINLGDAVEMALKESDNTAVRALVPELSKTDFDNVYEGLDIDLKINNDGALMTAKHYGSILKALYFSAVLTKDHSQEILNHLTQTKFRDKLPAGIPEEIPVAHKIGVIEEPEYEAYMDCGIVYVPRRPYLLCMISKSDDKTARERMSLISKIIYEHVSSQK